MLLASVMDNALRALRSAHQRTNQRKNRKSPVPDIVSIEEAALRPLPTYLSQFASPGLVSSILDGLIEPHEDPAWRDFGFTDESDYDYWTPRLCGLICVKMILDAHGATVGTTVRELTEQALRLGAYDTDSDSGWRYAPLIRLAEGYGLRGEVHGRLTLERICSEIQANRAVIASVHPGVIRGDYAQSPNGRKGGHLVVVLGCSIDVSKGVRLLIHNPSGRTPLTQNHVSVCEETFLAAFAGRGFTLWATR